MTGSNETLRDTPPILIVADDSGAAAAVEQAAGAVSVARRVGWAAAADAIAAQPRLAAVLADASGVPAALIDAALPEVVAAAKAVEARVVAAFAHEQLDIVAGHLLGGDAVLLCEPDASAWAAEAVLATADRHLVLNDAAREEERYRRLSEEVARIAATLTSLSRRDAPLGGSGGIPGAMPDPYVADRISGYGAPPAVDVDPADIRRAIRARRMRDDAFGIAGLFEDPAWDMLLDLFAAELERRRVSVSSLCIAAAVAPTTALRWIGKLIDAQLLERRADELDRRRAFVSLTARASTAMRNYAASVRRAGLPIA